MAADVYAEGMEVDIVEVVIVAQADSPRTGSSDLRGKNEPSRAVEIGPREVQYREIGSRPRIF